MKLVFSIFVIGILFLGSAGMSTAFAQEFKFEPPDSSVSTAVGSTFAVKMMINTGGISVVSGDALIIFDPAKVGISSAVTGGFFTDFYAPGLMGGTTNKFIVSSYELGGTERSTSTDKLFATLNLTTKACGSTQLSFECIGETGADSNIIRASDNKDIIKCPLTPLTLNLCGTTGPSNTPAPTGPTTTAAPTVTIGPTVPPVPTATPKPTSIPVVPTNPPPRPTAAVLPRAGSAEITVAAIGLGTLLTVVGILFIL